MRSIRYACFTALMAVAAANPAAAAQITNVAAPAAAAPAPTITVQADAAPAPAAAPLPAATSAVVITLGTTGDFNRKTVSYTCQGDVPSISIDYLNAPPNYLALIPLNGSTLVFNTVLSASGAKYAAGKYIWWSKGSDGSLYDETQGANAKPVLTCSAEANETP